MRIDATIQTCIVFFRPRQWEHFALIVIRLEPAIRCRSRDDHR